MTRFLTPLTGPIGLLWLVFVALTLWHLWRRQWARALFPMVVAVVMCVFGSTPLSARLLASLERPYAGVRLEQLPVADAVVMLGGVGTASRHDPFGIEIADAADRVLVAAEVLRQGRARTLVLGGGGPEAGQVGASEGELVNRWLSAWGLTRGNVLFLGTCRNTRDEAERTLALVRQHKWKRVLLVTSAYHLPRSEAVFRRLGVPVIPVGADFTGLAELAGWQFESIVPNWTEMKMLHYYLHELVGWWVYRLKGWVEPAPPKPVANEVATVARR